MTDAVYVVDINAVLPKASQSSCERTVSIVESPCRRLTNASVQKRLYVASVRVLCLPDAAAVQQCYAAITSNATDERNSLGLAFSLP